MSDYQKEKEVTSKWLLKICSVVLLVFFGFITISCSRSLPVEPPRPPKFSFEPPSVETKKLDIVLGIVAPSYDTKVLELPIINEEDRARMRSVIDLFRRSMASDFERMIIARGFNSKGPFKSLDYMTYPDKKGSDLTLTPKIFITTTDGTRRAGGMFLLASRDNSFLLASHDSYSCVLTVSGFIEMIILEPLSGEKMWIKKIDFEPVSVNCKFSYNIKDKGKITQRIEVEVDTRPEALGAALERIYPAVMETAWRYLHPDEVKRLKQESQEIRERKRY